MLDVPHDWGLADKVAIVTGGGAVGDGIGNGRAAAILLAKAGTKVVVVDRDGGLAKRTVEMIAEAGGEGMAFEADITKGSECAAMVKAAVDRFGFFNDPQTGVALAAAMKLVRSGTIPKSSRVVVVSTAHGLKFVDFKLRFHQREIPQINPNLSNLPIDVPADVNAVRAAIHGRLSA